MKIVNGDLIKLAKQGEFDLIAHGCNCFCTMGSGIAKTIKEELNNAFYADQLTIKGDINKLGNFSEAECFDKKGELIVKVLNCYTQYRYGSISPDIDYEALTLCMRKINTIYTGRSIGLPQIGAGRAGGNWGKILGIIKSELKDLDVTIVIFKP